MQCPNCGEETVNINGRQVCLDCGIEVSPGAPIGQPDSAVSNASEKENVLDSVPDSTLSSTPTNQEGKIAEQIMASKKETQVQDIPGQSIAEEIVSARNEDKQKEEIVSFVHPENYDETKNIPDPIVDQPNTEPAVVSEQKPTDSIEVKNDGIQTIEPQIEVDSGNINIVEPNNPNLDVSPMTEANEASSEVVEPKIDQEEELRKQLKEEKPLDSGNPIFENQNSITDNALASNNADNLKAEENHDVIDQAKDQLARSEEVEGVNLETTEKQNVDSISKINQVESVVSGDTSIETYLNDPVKDEVVNIRGGMSTNMEVLPANGLTNGSIKNIVITVFTIAILLVTALVIYLNWNGIMSLFYLPAE